MLILEVKWVLNLVDVIDLDPWMLILIDLVCFWLIFVDLCCFRLLWVAFGCFWLLCAAFGCFWLLLLRKPEASEVSEVPKISKS